MVAEPRWGGSGAPPHARSGAGLGGREGRREGGSLCGAARSPPAPPGSQGGDELRRLQLLPLLSLGEGPGQGRAIVLPGSCGAPGPRSRPSGGHVPSLPWEGRPPAQRGEGAAGPRQVWPCHGSGLCTRRGCGGDKASPPEPPPRGHGPGCQPPARGPDLGQRRTRGHGHGAPALAGSVARWGLLAKRAVPQGQGISPQPRGAPFPVATLPATAPSPSRVEAHLLRQSCNSRSWCFRKHVQISVWLKVSITSRDTNWEIPGLPAAQILCV